MFYVINLVLSLRFVSFGLVRKDSSDGTPHSNFEVHHQLLEIGSTGRQLPPQSLEHLLVVLLHPPRHQDECKRNLLHPTGVSLDECMDREQLGERSFHQFESSVQVPGLGAIQHME